LIPPWKVGYSCSTVASAETGQGAARHFWQMCDAVLGGGGLLLGLFDELKAAHRRRQQEAAAVARRRRAAEVQRWRQAAMPGHGDLA